MRISFICCPFKTSFGAYGSALKSALEAKTGTQVQWVAANCGCGDPMEANRQFLTSQCDYFDFPIPSEYRSTSQWKHRLRGATRSAMVYIRARKFESRLDRPQVVHFQQVLNGYGSKAVFSWLALPSRAVRVVTVHELDSDQLESPDSNKTYNRADAVIVHCDDMKKKLVQLGVAENKIHVVLHGTEIHDVASDQVRDGIVFYAGHKVMAGKGIEAVFQAIRLVQQRRPDNAINLKIHGHYGTETPAEAQRLAEKVGVTTNITWLNQIAEDEVVRLYRQSAVCVLPYSGSFAGLAASIAAACQLPIVCTRKAGLPDHLGDTAIWVDENNPEQIAARIFELLENEALRNDVGKKLLRRAQEHLSWDVIAAQTLRIYEDALRQKGVLQRVPDLSEKEAPGVVV